MYISLDIIGIVLLLIIVIISLFNKLNGVEQKIYNAIELVKWKSDDNEENDKNV